MQTENRWLTDAYHLTLNRRFCEFAFTGEVRVDITVYRDFETYSVLPSAKRYRNEFHDGVISVWLNENDTNL